MNDISCFINIIKCEGRSTDDIDKNSFSAFNRSFEEWAFNRCFGSCYSSSIIWRPKA